MVPHNLLGFQSASISEPLNAEKVAEDQATKKLEPQSSVSYVYQARLAELCCKFSATWCKNLISYTLVITAECPSEGHLGTCRIDIKPWHFWGKKGLKSFDMDRKRVDVYWDFRQAIFSNAPEPSPDYYVALVLDKELVLLLGDLRKEAYERTRSRPSTQEASFLSKKENVIGRKLFCTRAKLEDDQPEHDIMIENSLSGPDEPEMWISIGGTVAIRIMNLNWRFRGNEIVMVNNLPVQIYWDVHDWLFTSPTSGHGLFIFKTGKLDDPNARYCGGGEDEISCHDPSQMDSSTSEFCYLLHAWRVE